MKKIISVVLLVFAAASFTFVNPANAGDAAKGAAIFGANCAACHSGGRNTIVQEKTLKKDALEKYGMYSMEKIVYQVTNGKGAMPAYQRRFTPAQIEDVATYVLEKSEAGW